MIRSVNQILVVIIIVLLTFSLGYQQGRKSKVTAIIKQIEPDKIAVLDEAKGE